MGRKHLLHTLFMFSDSSLTFFCCEKWIAVPLQASETYSNKKNLRGEHYFGSWVDFELKGHKPKRFGCTR